MSIFAAMLACCCNPTDTPATDCPEGTPPCTAKTVTVEFTANPVQCDPVELVECEACPGWICMDQVRGCDCTDLAALSVPKITWLSGLSEAKAVVAWNTYMTTSGSFPDCVSTLHECSSTTQSYGAAYTTTMTFSVPCGGVFGGDCDGAISTQYYPDEASYVAGNGVRVDINGCCCDDCQCGGIKCSTVFVSLTAVWSVDVDAPAFGFILGTPYYCNCDIDHNDVGEFGVLGLYDPYQGTFPVTFTHTQTVTIAYEATIFTSQADCHLAPGAYRVRAVNYSNQQGAAWIPGFMSDGTDCLAVRGAFVENPANPSEIGCSGAASCGRTDLATAGWSVSVTVAP